MSGYSENQKLFLIFAINIVFAIIVLIFFHFFRQHRKDKLLTSKFHTDYKDAIIEGNNINEKGIRELDDRTDPLNQSSAGIFIRSEQAIKQLKQVAKDYSFFGWMKFVYNTSDTMIFSLCNGEGYIYLYFLRSTSNLFVVMSVLSLLILYPMYRIKWSKEGEELNSILNPTVHNAYDSPFKLWITLIISVAFTILAYYHLYTFTKKINSIRGMARKVDDSKESEIAMHTLHIRGINQSLSYLELKKMIDTFFDIHFCQMVIGIQIIPNYDILYQLIDKKFAYQAKHSSYEQMNIMLHPKRAKIFQWDNYQYKEIDAEVYYKHWCQITDNMITFYRKLNMKKNTGNAFICFKSTKVVEEILRNSSIILGKMNTFEGNVLQVENWIIKKAPVPSDIIWENIKYSKRWRTIRMIIFTLVLLIVCLIIITPNFINDELSPLIKDLGDQIGDLTTRNLITEYSYPLIVVCMNSGVIPFIVGYIAMAELHYKRSYREKSIFVKNVIFMLVNSLIIPTFGVLSLSGLKTYISFLVKSGWDWDISEGFIKNTYFFMRYIIQVTFISNCFQLLALPQYFVKKFRVFIASTDYEKFYASLIKKYFDYGYNYSYSITVFILTLTFSSTIPLIVPFGALFFYIKYFIDKYNLLFVYPAEFESHGNLTELVVKFALIGIFFFQFIISNLFIKIFPDKDYAIYATIFYIAISSALYFYMKSVFLASSTQSNDSIVDEILTKTKLKSLFHMQKQSNYYYDEPNGNVTRASQLLSKTNAELTEEQLVKMLQEVYVHPVEKKQIVNPMQIWNDSYNFMKTSQDNKEKKSCVEYEDIIRREPGDSLFL